MLTSGQTHEGAELALTTPNLASGPAEKTKRRRDDAEAGAEPMVHRPLQALPSPTTGSRLSAGRDYLAGDGRTRPAPAPRYQLRANGSVIWRPFRGRLGQGIGSRRAVHRVGKRIGRRSMSGGSRATVVVRGPRYPSGCAGAYRQPVEVCWPWRRDLTQSAAWSSTQSRIRRSGVTNQPGRKNRVVRKRLRCS